MLQILLMHEFIKLFQKYMGVASDYETCNT
jgi:hypothetical protein